MHALAVLEIPIGLNIQISNLPARSHQIARAKAIVTVSFVVGVDGNVEDARLVESSDERFNTVSIEAIRQYKFIPAEGSAGPEPAMEAIPFKFGYKPAASD